MADLIYTVICSVDGLVNDADGGFEWAAPDEEVHAFANELERSVGTHLYGRRLYETMSYWEHPPDGSSAVELAYAEAWQNADKVVYSSTLSAVSTRRTRLERRFDPDVVQALKDAATSPISVGGPTLAASALRAGLVDEVQLLVVPHVVGNGTATWPDDLKVALELLEERRFVSGVVYLRYRVLG